MITPDRAVPARKARKASGTMFTNGPGNIIAANATVPSTVTTLDNVANRTSAKAPCIVSSLIRMVPDPIPSRACSRIWRRCYPATPCPIVRAARSASAAMVSVGGCIPAVGNTIPPTMNRLA